MANDKRFIVKNGLGTPNVRFANGSNTTAFIEMNYTANGALVISSNSTFVELIKISDSDANLLNVNGAIAFGTSGISINSTFYEATANNASYAYGKQESQLYVANAVFATGANNALRLNGKQESQLSVNSAAWATTANNSTYAYGKQESQLYVANAVYATLAGGVLNSYVANSNFSNTANNALYLGGNPPAYYTNASNISTGTLAEARLPYRMDQNVRTTDSVEFKDLVVTGNVYFSGNATLIKTTTLSVSDPMIYLNGSLSANVSNVTANGTYVTYYANNNFQDGYIVRITDVNPSQYNVSFNDNKTIVFANSSQFVIQSTATGAYVGGGFAYTKAALNPDVGFVAGLTADGTYQHVGLVRDATDGVFKVFDGMTAEPDQTFIDFSAATIADFQANVLTIASASVGGTPLTSTNYGGTANNANYAYGKQESQLSVANAVFAQTANNSLRLNGKQESQLAVNSAAWATSANNALFAYGKQETQLSTNNSVYLAGRTWQTPFAIGSVNANTGAFTTLTASGVTTLNANLVLNGTGLVANNSTGVVGQVLASNGTSVYWTNANNISGTVSQANNTTYVNGKAEGQLSVNSAVYAGTANNALYAYGKQEGQQNANNANFLAGRRWETAGAIGATVANTGNFTIANTTNYLSVKNIAHLSGDSNTTSAVTQVQIASFSANTYGSAKIYIQATETTTTRRHVTELLVVHDNTTASATEYGMLFTGPTALATYEVDISGNNVRVLATPASANTIAFRVSEQLFTI